MYQRKTSHTKGATTAASMRPVVTGTPMIALAISATAAVSRGNGKAQSQGWAPYRALFRRTRARAFRPRSCLAFRERSTLPQSGPDSEASTFASGSALVRSTTSSQLCRPSAKMTQRKCQPRSVKPVSWLTAGTE